MRVVAGVIGNKGRAYNAAIRTPLIGYINGVKPDGDAVAKSVDQAASHVLQSLMDKATSEFKQHSQEAKELYLCDIAHEFKVG